jgi:hypothetical protein
MCNLSYYSDLTVKDFEEIPPERWNLTEYADFFLEAYPECFPDSLADELFDFFNLLAHPLRRCFDMPAKSPRNEEIESAIKNRGTEGSHTFMRDNGSRFVLRPLNSWMFKGHTLRRKHYYTSDRRKALLYFDVDCHLPSQTKADAQAARKLIEQEMTAFLGVCPLFLGSERGENGYLKVALDGTSPEMANEVFDQLEAAIRLLFAKHGIMAEGLG